MQGLGRRILIITGDQSIVNRIVSQISSLGHETFTAHNENLAITTITELHPDIIILDLNIEGVDSFAVFEWIRQNKNINIASTPVIIATQGSDLLQISRAIKLGVKDYFVKDAFDAVGVVQKVKKHIDEIRDTSTAYTLEGTGASIKSLSVLSVPALPTGLKVLIIEDDKFLRDLSVQKLSKENFNVISAVDGEQGISLAEKELPTIILLDILLPGIDGFEVLRRVRANPALRDTKVAMLSNFGQREDIEKALKAGANQFFVKANYTLPEIIEEVKKMTDSAITP